MPCSFADLPRGAACRAAIRRPSAARASRRYPIGSTWLTLGTRDDLAAWARGVELWRSALACLGFRAVLVIRRPAARLSRRKLGQRTRVPESTIWYSVAGERYGRYGIRQLLQFATR